MSYWRKYVHEVLVNRLGGLSLPRKSVVRLTDRPDMTLDVNHGCKTTMQQQCNNEYFPYLVRFHRCINVAIFIREEGSLALENFLFRSYQRAI